MSNFNSTLIRGGLLALVIALPLGSQSALAAKCARGPVSAGGTGATINRAMSNAKAHWQQSTEKRYGLLWSRWSWSKNKSRHCSKNRARVRCRVKATPCRAL
jgi:hypothetical protein